MKTLLCMQRRRDLALVGALVVVGIVVAACGDGTTPPPANGEAPPDTLRVVAVDRDSGAPRAGVKITLMDEHNRLAAPPQVTGDDGRATFVMIDPSGSVFVVAFTGDLLFVHELPAAITGPVTTVTVGTRTQPGTLPRLAGTVVDAETQEPLGEVFLSLSPYLSGYLGRTEPSDDVTLDDGLFSVSNIPFAADPFSGNLRQIMPLFVTREGYLPTSFLHAMLPGANDLDIIGLVIALEPDRGGSGTLTGVIAFGREPVVGLPVGLGGVGDPEGKSAVGLPGQVAVTDQDGRYTFNDLAAGGYLLHAGFRLDDGWLMPNQPASRLYTVDDDATTTADTLQVVRTITPLEPLGHQTTVPDRFAWLEVAEADSYTVHLGGVRIGRTATTALEEVDLGGLAPGWHLWNVTATTAAGGTVGGSEVYARFRQPEPETAE